MIADRAYSARAIRSRLRGRRIRTVVPQAVDQVRHRKRRGPATRTGELALAYQAAPHLAAVLIRARR